MHFDYNWLTPRGYMRDIRDAAAFYILKLHLVCPLSLIMSAPLHKDLASTSTISQCLVHRYSTVIYAIDLP